MTHEVHRHQEDQQASAAEFHWARAPQNRTCQKCMLILPVLLMVGIAIAAVTVGSLALKHKISASVATKALIAFGAAEAVLLVTNYFFCRQKPQDRSVLLDAKAAGCEEGKQQLWGQIESCMQRNRTYFHGLQQEIARAHRVEQQYG